MKGSCNILDVFALSFVLLLTKVQCSSPYKFPFLDPSLPWDNRVDYMVGRPTLDEIAKLKAVVQSSSPYKYPFLDPSLPWDKRVDDLVGRLTLDEIAKLTAVEHGSHPATPAIPRLGIKPWVGITDCNRGFDNTNGTTYPQSIGLAATFSRDIIYRMNNATSYEIRAWYNNNRVRGIYSEFHGLGCFSPNVNIMRHPLWGRNQETSGEDPYLTSELVRSFIRGLKGDDPRLIRVACGCKHFDVHGGPENIPQSRKSFNAVISMRDWRTTWLPAFRACVEEETMNIMCSFNSINGTPACANKQLLTDILRGDFGYKGLVVSDNNAVDAIVTGHHYVKNTYEAMVAAIKAGLNLELGQTHYWEQTKAVKNGDLTEEEVRNNVKPIIYVRMRTGEFDPPEMNPYLNISNMSLINAPAHRQIALEAAMKSFVLLKNKNNALPLNNATKPKKVAIVGPFADDYTQIWGNYGGRPNKKLLITPYSGLKHLGATSAYTKGCTDGHLCKKYSRTDVQKTVKRAEVVIICLGLGTDEGESNDRDSLELPGHQAQLLKDAATYSSNATVILLLFNADPVNITWAFHSDRVGAILACFYPAQTAGAALYNVVIGAESPGGRLPYTWPTSLNQVPSITNYSMDGHTYRYYHGDPMFPFGYGLSYSRFNYSGFTAEPSTILAGQNVTLTVQVQNTGPRDADEVVQVYMTWNNASVPVPQRTLVAFDRIHIRANQTGHMTSTLTAHQMAVWHDDKKWVVEPGTLTLCAGGQQPNQKREVPSNVICKTITVK